jgi:acyl carrier protein
VDTHEAVRQVVVNVSGLPADFPAGANLYMELSVPSVGAMQILLELEDRFRVQVPDEEFVEATTLDALVTLVDRLVDRLRTNGADAASA